MSEYDFQRRDMPGGRAMDYGTPSSGAGIWSAIGLIAVLALLAIIVFAGSSGTTDEGATGAGTVAPEAAAPEAAAPEATAPATTVPLE